MKNALRMVIVLACFIFCGYIEGHAATTDQQMVRQYVRDTYSRGYKVRIAPAEKTPDRVLANRKGKRVVYVDMFRTVSDGKGGGYVTTKGPFKGNYIRYAKRVRAGKRVRVFYIYNPSTNYTDDVVAIVSDGKLREE